jgi:acyl-CoA hydrolase
MPAISNWREKITTPLTALKKIKPGMNIFIGTGAAEPRTLVKKLMTSKAGNLQDLTLIQMVSLGDAISLEVLNTQKYRLKTVFTGWAASRCHPRGSGGPDPMPPIQGARHDHQRPDCGGCRLYPGNPA